MGFFDNGALHLDVFYELIEKKFVEKYEFKKIPVYYKSPLYNGESCYKFSGYAFDLTFTFTELKENYDVEFEIRLRSKNDRETKEEYIKRINFEKSNFMEILDLYHNLLYVYENSSRDDLLGDIVVAVFVKGWIDVDLTRNDYGYDSD